MERISPSYPVKNVAKAAQSYVETLGFQIVFDNIPVYARVQRGDVIIGLGMENQERPAGCGDSYIEVNDVEALYEEYKSRNAVFKSELSYQKEYGLKDFIIFDLDGNTIGIGGQ